MKHSKHIGFLILMAISSNLWAYGSSSSSSACAKPKFTDFTPAEHSEVAAGSDFSFIASENTTSNSTSRKRHWDSNWCKNYRMFWTCICS